ncbi:MAG: beta-ketoacyl synthase N-terminal-like domain-containing protein [Phycisphaerae bacterium]|jgi:3-oxoacyl-(acyl-carrier-protein) synthase
MSTGPIVLTGCGWITPFAAGNVCEILKAGQGLGGREQWKNALDAAKYWAVPDSKVAEFPNLGKEVRRDKGAWIASVAFELACIDASLDIDSLDGVRLGLALGCGLAGQIGMVQFADEVRKQSPRFVSPIHFPQTVGNYIAGALARAYDIRGPNVTLANDDASSLDAIAEAAALLDNADAEIMIAGGVEPLTDELAAGFDETATFLSEGACLFVMETSDHAAQRGATPLAVVEAVQRPGAEPGTHAPAQPTDANILATDGTRVVSVAGLAEPGSISVDHWVGRCIGASGACAVAAAIGAMQGLPVPVGDPSGAVTSPPPAQQPHHPVTNATVVASGTGGSLRTLELSIPPGA